MTNILMGDLCGLRADRGAAIFLFLFFVNCSILCAQTPVEVVSDVFGAPASGKKEASATKTANKIFDNEDVTVIETEVGSEQIQEIREEAVKGSLPMRPAATIKPRASYDEAQKTEAAAPARNLTNTVLREREVIQINRSLKKMIEQNEKLRNKNDELDSQLKRFRGQRTIEVNRMNDTAQEIDAYKQEIQKVYGTKAELEKNIQALKEEIAGKEKTFGEKISTLQERLAQKEKEADEITLPDGETISAAGKPLLKKELPKIRADQKKGLDVLTMIGDAQAAREKIKANEGKIHYNMGNSFFIQGEYAKAFKEYRKAVELMPQDANANFNLAFVSSDYLHDMRTALKYYRQYLFLNPDAEDAGLVSEKILEAELYIRAYQESPIEQDIEKQRRITYEQ